MRRLRSDDGDSQAQHEVFKADVAPVFIKDSSQLSHNLEQKEILIGPQESKDSPTRLGQQAFEKAENTEKIGVDAAGVEHARPEELALGTEGKSVSNESNKASMNIFNTGSQSAENLPDPSPTVEVEKGEPQIAEKVRSSGTTSAPAAVDSEEEPARWEGGNSNQGHGDKETQAPNADKAEKIVQRPNEDIIQRKNASNYQHVIISGKRYFGGMETIFHRYLNSQICRIYNPCLRYDGTLVLPSWMQRNDVTISRYCGVKKVEFTLDDSLPPSTEPLEEIDLFGIETHRQHAPNFLLDFIPGIIALDTVFGHYAIDRHCYTRMGANCGLLRSKGAIKPALFLDRRAKIVTIKGSWVRQLIHLAVPRSAHDAIIKYWTNVFYEREETGLKCFRSAYVSKPWSPTDNVQLALFQKLQMFSASRIRKSPREFSSAVLSTGERQQCALGVTIINRKPVARHFDRVIGRYIPNIPSIREETLRLATEFSYLNITFLAVRLEERPIEWQIHVMKKTDILVGGHGSGLANMIFMRAFSSLLEIQPFNYYPTTYETIAGQLASLSYDSMVAQPDPDAFYACLDHYYKSGSPDYDEAMKIGKRFKKSASEYKKSSRNTHSLTIQNLDAKFAHIGTCAKMQQLKVDPTEVARAIVALARAACNRRAGNTIGQQGTQ